MSLTTEGLLLCLQQVKLVNVMQDYRCQRPIFSLLSMHVIVKIGAAMTEGGPEIMT